MDSRNLQERIDELEAQEDKDEEETEELNNLLALKEETESSGWEFGIFFISEDEFEDYAREFAEDIGAIARDTQWPATCIDWEQATNELRMDYSEVEYNGDTYLYREA